MIMSTPRISSLNLHKKSPAFIGLNVTTRLSIVVALFCTKWILCSSLEVLDHLFRRILLERTRAQGI
jgi:hypothetical protein